MNYDEDRATVSDCAKAFACGVWKTTVATVVIYGICALVGVAIGEKK